MPPKRLYMAAAIAVLSFFMAGCSIGYTNLKPGENAALYARLFHDVISTYDEPHWLWVRGSIPLDYNGDGKVEEEAVIATIQQGTKRRPGPIEAAYLVICKVAPDGERTTIARTLLFEENPVPNAPHPGNDLGIVNVEPLTRVRAQVVEDKASFKETVVVYFSGDAMPSSNWYAGFTRQNGQLTKIFETAIWQGAPGILAANLDTSPEATPYGYQLVLGVAALPQRIIQKLEATRDTPLWGHVYARDADGLYRQADARFGNHYRELENSWNQLYLKALFHNLPAADLAWFEYHIGLLNHYTGNDDMAARLLEKAANGAEDKRLRDGINNALQLLQGRDPTAWSIAPKENTAATTGNTQGVATSK